MPAVQVLPQNKGHRICGCRKVAILRLHSEDVANFITMEAVDDLPVVHNDTFTLSDFRYVLQQLVEFLGSERREYRGQRMARVTALARITDLVVGIEPLCSGHCMSRRGQVVARFHPVVWRSRVLGDTFCVVLIEATILNGF